MRSEAACPRDIGATEGDVTVRAHVQRQMFRAIEVERLGHVHLDRIVVHQHYPHGPRRGLIGKFHVITQWRIRSPCGIAQIPAADAVLVPERGGFEQELSPLQVEVPLEALGEQLRGCRAKAEANVTVRGTVLATMSHFHLALSRAPISIVDVVVVTFLMPLAMTIAAHSAAELAPMLACGGPRQWKFAGKGQAVGASTSALEQAPGAVHTQRRCCRGSCWILVEARSHSEVQGERHGALRYRHPLQGDVRNAAGLDVAVDAELLGLPDVVVHVERHVYPPRAQDCRVNAICVCLQAHPQVGCEVDIKR